MVVFEQSIDTQRGIKWIRFFWWAYGIQALFVVPMLLGDIYRREAAPWADAEAASRAIQFGRIEGLLTWYGYAILYAALFLIPYGIMSAWQQSPRTEASSSLGFMRSRALRRDCSVWIGFTLLVFWEPFFALLRSIAGSVNAWISIVWLVYTTGFILKYRVRARAAADG